MLLSAIPVSAFSFSVPAPAVSEGSQEFDLKIKAYEAVMAEIQALKADFDKAYQAQDSAKMTEIQNAAAPLIQKAEQAFAAVVPAANAAYGSSDGTNEKLNQFMLVYANYLLSMDEYDEAFSLFKTFLSSRCESMFRLVCLFVGRCVPQNNRAAPG